MLSAPFIARPIATLLLAIGLALAGIAAYLGLPVAPLPRVDIPTIVVNASQPGADPAVMASSVAAPLERRLGAINGVTEITSTSSLGASTIVVQFDLNRRIEDAAKDVMAAINAAGTDLPPGLPNPPSFRKANPADAPVLMLAITSDTVAPGAVYDAVDSILSPRIARIEGVAQVLVTGAEQPAVRVQVNPAAATAAGVSLEDIRQSLLRSNITQPTGLLDGQDQAASIAVNDRLSTPQEFGQVIVRATNGAVVRVTDVARVSQGVRDRRQSGTYNGRPAVLLLVFKQPDANVLQVVDEIRAMLPGVQRWMPAGIRIDTLRDRTESIRASIEEVQDALLISIVLVMAVVAVFLRRRSAIVATGIAVPLSLLGTLAVMWLCGFSLNNLTLMALTISVGFVVDDAIVMIENMARMREQGLPPARAALEGARQIGFTVLSITLSLIAVFIPLLFMPGIPGRMFREFSVTLAVAVAISGIISLTVTPAAAAWLAAGKDGPPGWFGRLFDRAMDAVVAGYMRSLAITLRFRRLMVLLTVSLVGLTVWLYVIVPKEFFPNQDTGLVFGFIQAPPDTSFQRMVQLQGQVVQLIMRDPAVESIGTSVGGGGGFGSVSNGRMFLSLKPQEQRPGVTADMVVNRLRPQLGRIAGAQVFLRPISDVQIGGRVGNAAYQFVLLTPDLDDLQAASEMVVNRLRQLPQLADVNSDQQRAGLVARLVIDRDRAAQLGVSIQALDATLNNAFAQRQVSVIYRTRNQYRVVQEIDPALTEDATHLEQLYLPGRGGTMVPLAAVMRVERSNAPLTVTHQGQFPAATITFNLPEGVVLSQATAAIDAAVAQLPLPASVRTQYAGSAAAFRQQSAGDLTLILAALVCIYIVLGILYESLIHPLTIISTLPTAGIGALLALLATNTPFTLIALIGVILLMGIVKKNAIMLVDFALQHEREGGEGGMQAILEACRERFRPILMTTLAALFGAVPLALAAGPGAELRQPLGIAIIGGLLLSQLLTLYTTPAVYLSLERLAGERRRPITTAVPAE